MTKQTETALVKLVNACTALVETISSLISTELDEPATTTKKTSRKKASKKKTTRKAKKEEPEDDDIEVEDDDLLGEDDTEDEDEVEIDVEDDDLDEDEPTLDDVKDAFRAYIKKFANIKTGRANAKKVLDKVKAKSIDSIPESKYQAVIDLLAKKK